SVQQDSARAVFAANPVHQGARGWAQGAEGAGARLVCGCGRGRASAATAAAVALATRRVARGRPFGARRFLARTRALARAALTRARSGALASAWPATVTRASAAASGSGAASSTLPALAGRLPAGLAQVLARLRLEALSHAGLLGQHALGAGGDAEVLVQVR